MAECGCVCVFPRAQLCGLVGTPGKADLLGAGAMATLLLPSPRDTKHACVVISFQALEHLVSLSSISDLHPASVSFYLHLCLSQC